MDSKARAKAKSVTIRRAVGMRARAWARAAAALRTAFTNRPGLFRLLWHRRFPLLIAAAGLPIGAEAGYIAGLTGAFSSLFEGARFR